MRAICGSKRGVNLWLCNVQLCNLLHHKVCSQSRATLSIALQQSIFKDLKAIEHGVRTFDKSSHIIK